MKKISKEDIIKVLNNWEFGATMKDGSYVKGVKNEYYGGVAKEILSLVEKCSVLDAVIIRCDFEENTECKNQNIKYTTGHCVNCGGLAIDL